MFDSSHFIHKYYLSLEDKEKLFPVDICAVEMMVAHDERINNRNRIPEEFEEYTIFYRDIRLEKRVKPDLVKKVLMAISQYNEDCRCALTSKEIRAALNLNDWLQKYEKILLKKRRKIESELSSLLHRNDHFLVDYEISLKISFYLREDDLFNDDKANHDDWDKDVALMCCINPGCSSSKKTGNSKYWGIGDDLDHNDIRSSSDHSNPLFQARHCLLFHELTQHCEVPFKHLIRIGWIWADFEVIHQNAFDIDLEG